jgi:hypothetical protein
MANTFRPSQYTQKYQQTDPFQNLRPQQQALEGMLGARANAGPMGVQNPYAGPRPEQTASLAALLGYQGAASPLYGQSVAQQGGTVGGGYLDPMQQAPFQRLSAARQNIARDLFGQAADVVSGGAAARGTYNSSARQAQQLREANRLYNQAAQDIAQAGWGQYGRERELQEAAARYGTQLAPGLAGQVFNAGEQLRSAQQAGNQAQLAAQLQAAGLDQGNIQNILRYMQLASGQALPNLVGQSPWQQGTSVLNTVGQVAGPAAAAMGCWIAAALYGAESPAVALARHWIFTAWRGPRAAFVRVLYRHIGRPVAWGVRRSSTLRQWLRPWFDRAVVRGAWDLMHRHLEARHAA